MRLSHLVLALALAGCISPPAPTTRATLVSADASTSLLAGESLRADYVTHRRGGDDPLIILTLRHSDGRKLAFNEANHAPNDLAAQAPGGPLSQIMGLLGQEAPTLYRARRDEHRGAPFLCGPDGPAAIGVYESGGGSVHLVGLKQEIQFETRPDGQTEAVPYSPDQVCARLRFTKG